MREHKLAPDSELSAQKGINLIEEVLLEMGFLWHVAGPFDHGIDGRIELRDAKAKLPLNRLLGVQSKAWGKFVEEDEQGFSFLCDPADIDYWMRSESPVLLVCSHPDERLAWFVCVTDLFSDAEVRAKRRVRFDKNKDRFDASKAAELLQLGARRDPVVPRRPPAPPEVLVSNLLPIQHGQWIWRAPSECRDHQDVQALYEAAGGRRASDYLLRGGHLYSLRDPRECGLRHLCDVDQVTSFAASDWAQSDDAALVRQWVELLRRSLLHQTKHELQWQPARRLFYFPASEPLKERHIEGPTGKRTVVKVKHYIDRKSGKERLKYVRHQAFRPGFVEADGVWHLEIEPDYYFTRDGERESAFADEYLAGIKRLDKNTAVLGHLRMWEHLLSRPPSLLSNEPPLLGFGKLVTVEVEVGIDDALWRGRENRDADALPGQEELAA